MKIAGAHILHLLLVFLVGLSANVYAQQPVRQIISLNNNWRTVADDANKTAYNGFERSSFNTRDWKLVNVPHNWDEYEGYRRLKHGNRHGYAWYRTTFNVSTQAGKKYFLWFEGVGSFATVWLNGKQVGYHAGGRTSFTLDVTQYVLSGKPNLLAVRADHPAFITTLPWVCGGCSNEVGFSEGSQPMGIFRPVHLVITNPVRITPFGVHIWNDSTVSEKSALLNIATEIKNYSGQPANIKVVSSLLDANNKLITSASIQQHLNSGATATIPQQINFKNVKLWSLTNPYLYKLQTSILQNGKLIDQTTTDYGIRWISWPIGRAGDSKQFLLNGKPVFINGVAEYEHNFGQSHAFTDEQVHTHAMQVKAAGFNAFRDAHQPHNLRFQHYWDEMGILWWPQFAAHIWYDTPEFRNNFKALLIDWVKERRNSPSVILWGLENESKLPAGFARECSDIIRKLDPTASSQRKITTCNGGEGTDWDVPQNWTGTYGGDPLKYGEDLQRQVLIGEYGSWRSIDLHTEGPFVQNGALSENRMAQLMETKIWLAESVKDKAAGHFFWLLNSHDNPGRVQAGEGYREMDRIGPVNYKGLFTPWGEPTDAFYLYRANYAPKETQPMVYIVSHTWPGRWLKPGNKDSICVYSNCDEVELFNDVDGASLGKKKQPGIGKHFQWDGVNIQYNVLKTVGYVQGKKVAQDMIVLNHLPQAPHLQHQDEGLTKPAKGLNYLYRVNCGGPAYTDQYGNNWSADVHQTSTKTWGSTSWTDDFKNMPAMFASQRRTFDFIDGTADETLFKTFRYGRDKLKYDFPVPNGEYAIELYFTEPWYGIGGGLNCKGWRLFDVSVNGKTLIKNLDIWAEAGADKALKKTLKVKVTNGHLTINFPQVASGQAVISAIAIGTVKHNVKPTPASLSLIQNLKINYTNGIGKWRANTWLDAGDKPFTDEKASISAMPPNLYGAEWLAMPKKVNIDAQQLASFTVNQYADVFIGLDDAQTTLPNWMQGFDDTKSNIQTDENGGHLYHIYHRQVKAGSKVTLGSATNELMYTIAVMPVNKMERATDLKPVVSYKVQNAMLTGSAALKDNGERKVVDFKNDNAGTISWIISPGVADLYTLRIKFANTTNKNFKADIKILAADGTLVKNGGLTFEQTPAGKWKTIETTTGTSINAGNYKVLISVEHAPGLSISGLEVQ